MSSSSFSHPSSPIGCWWRVCIDKLAPSLSVFYMFQYMWYIASSLIVSLWHCLFVFCSVIHGFLYPTLTTNVRHYVTPTRATTVLRHAIHLKLWSCATVEIYWWSSQTCRSRMRLLLTSDVARECWITKYETVFLYQPKRQFNS